MYTAAGHVLTINGANKTASVRMDGLDLAVLTEEDGRRRLKPAPWFRLRVQGSVPPALLARMSMMRIIDPRSSA